MQAQKIRPHVMTPTISAVTPDHVQSTRISSACLVTPVGQPNRSFFSASWAEPARLYGAGRRARLLLDAARESVAESIGARADEVSFAANGTQALHAAVLGSLAGNQRAGRAFVHSAVEHSAVLHAARAYAADGGSAVPVGVDALGRVDA